MTLPAFEPTVVDPSAPAAPRLRVLPVRPVDPPYDDERAAGAATGPGPAVQGALALRLATPLRPQPLHLVRDAEEGHGSRFGRAHTPRSALPDPHTVALRVGRALLEVLSGDRPVAQLRGCATPRLVHELEQRAHRRRERSWAASMRSLRVSEPSPSVAEVTAVVQRGPRCGALAFRLDGLDGRWQVTALQVGF